MKTHHYYGLIKNSLSKNGAEISIDTISVLLALYVFFSIGMLLIPSYYSPGYLIEFRSFATIESAMAFQEGINPFALEEPNGATNLYSFMWPLIVAKVGSLLGWSDAERLRTLAFSINLFINIRPTCFFAALFL